MKDKVHVEVCCASLRDCLTAQQCGADAIELVSAHLLGGLTPSAGLLCKVKERLDMPVSAMVRPRGAGFCYSPEDFEVMCEDAKRFVEIGADGIVFGFLLPDGTLDYERCARFMEYIGDCEAVFHRAIDVTPDPVRTAEQLVSLGVTRILTSGGKQDAFSGAETIRELVERFGKHIQILAGGGVRAGNVRELTEKTGVKKVHLGGTAMQSDPSTRGNPMLNFGSEAPKTQDAYPEVAAQTLSKVITALQTP